MPEAKVEHKKTWQTLFIFLTLVTLISALFHYAIIALYPSRIYVGALMWSPAVAAILTLKLTGRPIASLPWNWGRWKYIRLSYWVPALYVLLT
ncbi:MAG: CPBP family intramembrane glutamate endopeptidase, partial [Robiginitalea sp.]